MAIAGHMSTQPVSSLSVPSPLPLSLDQAKLNIEARSRTSRLPWRGQFSPELIDYLIDVVCPDSRSFLDPFCGSGTVLYEAVEKGHTAYGMEVNPAAWHLASLASFAGLPSEEKAAILRQIKALMSASSFTSGELFSSNSPETILSLITSADSHPFLRRALAAAILLGMGNEKDLSSAAISRGLFSVVALLTDLEPHSRAANCFLGDARSTPLASNSIDAVITSPPYINVFNYHQNYRPAAELLGWKPLEAARSEIGANRKHRQNRFLTVVQYCLDMSQCLSEMGRVLRENAPLVIILGRTSNVLGASFENGALIKALIESAQGFSDVHQSERVFTNRFGERIFEDILIARRQGSIAFDLNDARKVGVTALNNALGTVPDKNREALQSAIAGAAGIHPSPMLNVSVPAPFAAI